MIIPKEVKSIIQKLQEAGFEAYIVGGCVRDFLLAKNQKTGMLQLMPNQKKFKKFFQTVFMKIIF